MLSVSAADLAREHGDRYFTAQRVRQLLVTALHKAGEGADRAATKLRLALGAGESFRLMELEQALESLGVSVSRFDMYSVLMQHWNTRLGGVSTDDFVIEVLSERLLTRNSSKGTTPDKESPVVIAENSISVTPSAPVTPRPSVQSSDISQLTASLTELRSVPPPAPYATWTDDFLSVSQEISNISFTSPAGTYYHNRRSPAGRPHAAGYSSPSSLSAAETIASGYTHSPLVQGVFDPYRHSLPGFLLPETRTVESRTSQALKVTMDAAAKRHTQSLGARVAYHSPVTPPYATLSKSQLESALADLPNCALFSRQLQLEPAGRRRAVPEVDESILPFTASWMGPRPVSRRGCIRPQTASIVQRDGSYTSK